MTKFARVLAVVVLSCWLTLAACSNGTDSTGLETAPPENTAAPTAPGLPSSTSAQSPNPPTSTIAASPTVEVVGATPENFTIDGPFILQHISGGEIFLEEILTGYIRELPTELRIFEDNSFLGWTRKGCGFYVRMDNFDIVEVDLEGNILRTVFSIENLDVAENDPATSIGWVSPGVNVSPSENWILFYIGSGENRFHEGFGGRFDTTNVFLLPVEGGAAPTQISRNGGAWFYEWSHDSNTIAFTDKDGNGVFQLFLMSIDGAKVSQITDFAEGDAVPFEISWAPNDKYLTFSVGTFEGEFTDWIYSLESETLIQIEGQTSFAWDQDSTLYAFGNGRTVILDPSSGLEIESFFVPGQTLYFTPYGVDHKLVCVGFCLGYGADEDGLFYLDLGTLTVEKKPNFETVLDTAGWWHSPVEFTSEAECHFP